MLSFNSFPLIWLPLCSDPRGLMDSHSCRFVKYFARSNRAGEQFLEQVEGIIVATKILTYFMMFAVCGMVGAVPTAMYCWRRMNGPYIDIWTAVYWQRLACYLVPIAFVLTGCLGVWTIIHFG